MPAYTFRIQNGNLSGSSESSFNVENQAEAWAEMNRICGTMLGRIGRHLRPDSDWHLEMLDEQMKPVFRVRLVAEHLHDRSREIPTGA